MIGPEFILLIISLMVFFVVITKMYFTMVGYSELKDSGGVLVPITPLVDQHITANGDNVFVPAFAQKIMMAWGQGATLDLARIVAPSLRGASYPDIGVINRAFNTLRTWFGEWYEESLRDLDVAEGLQFHVAESAVGAEQERGIYLLTNGMTAKPEGVIETIHGVGTTTTVAEAWTQCAIVWDQVLRAGVYEIVGLKVEGASMIAGRLIIPDSKYRPGCIGTQDGQNVTDERFRMGNLGAWGKFDARFIPDLEIWTSVIEAAQEVYIDVVRIGDSE